MREWNFTIEAETPTYFWNRVIFYVKSHDRRLDTQEHGPLELEPLGKPKHPNPDPGTAMLWKQGTILGVVLDSIDADHLPTEAEEAAFLEWLRDPNSDGPKSLRGPQRVVVARCVIAPLGAHRQTVRMWTPIPEAIPYVIGLLEGLGYPEIAARPERPTGPQKPERTASRDDWLQYYQDCMDTGIKYTQKDLALDLHLSESRVGELRGNWLAEHGPK